MLVHFDRSILNPLCCWCIHFFLSSFELESEVYLVLSTFSWASYLWVCLCMADDIPSRSHMMMMSRSDLQGRETNFTVHCSQCSWHMIASWWKRSIFSLQWFLYWASLYYIVYIHILGYFICCCCYDFWYMTYEYLCSHYYSWVISNNWWDKTTTTMHMQVNFLTI